MNLIKVNLLKSYLLSISIFVGTSFSLLSQESVIKHLDFTWEKSSISLDPMSNTSIESMACLDCYVDIQNPQLSRKMIQIDWYDGYEVKINVINVSSITSPIQIKNSESIPEKTVIQSNIVDFRGQKNLQIEVKPYFNNGNVQLVTSCDLEISPVKSKSDHFNRGNRNKNLSILNDGNIYKIAINKSGIYKITGQYIANELGVALNSFDPKTIKLYGGRGGLIPEIIAENRIDDLEEIGVKAVGLEDGKFDSNDYLLFYGEGPNMFKYDESKNSYTFEQNIYDKFNYYFIKFDNQVGKRISVNNSNPTAEKYSNLYDDFQRYESDQFNLLGFNESTEGTGQEWFGDYFGINKSQNFEDKFDFKNIEISKPIKVKSEVAVHNPNSVGVKLTIDGNSTSKTVSGTGTQASDTFAKKGVWDVSTTISSTNPEINITVNSSTAEAWLDYIQVQSVKKLDLDSNKSVEFSNLSSKDYASFGFNITDTKSKEIWNITNPFNVEQLTVSGGKFSFYTDSIAQKFIAFDPNQEFDIPTFVKKVENQNLHSIQNAQMIIVYHKNFEEEAKTLAQHRSQNDNLNIVTVNVEEIFNEFGSGRKEPTAIRDFTKMIYDRDRDFYYLLLFGDGSYDYKLIDTRNPENNFVPVYETKESLNPISGYPSDDFFGLLSENEGLPTLEGAIDIAVGRLTVKSTEEAKNVVNKIINYDNNSECLGDWRLRCLFMADDEDSSVHLSDSDYIANSSFLLNEDINQKKVYLDAYIQESTPGGTRYPAVTEAVNNAANQGLLVMNYLGHGGPKGLAQERVLKIPDIQSWDNLNKLPFFITATCSFSGYDDPSLVTAGEEALLNPRGGAVALLTTTRAVYINQNKQLTKSVFDTLFIQREGVNPSFGQVMLDGKTSGNAGGTDNRRKFTLLGDPSQKIAMPKHKIFVMSINGKNPSKLDTIQALQKMQFSGEVRDYQGHLLSDFNGDIDVIVFDKKSTEKTLGNDPTSTIKYFSEYKNVIFKGVFSVANGKFECEFIVPKDISYDYGNGRISLYAQNGSVDASGHNQDFTIGGLDPDGIADDQGPKVEVFINDESFVYGGTTGTKPILLSKLSDDYGINLSSSSLGHDISATLKSESTQKIYILNEYFQSNKNDAKSGTVKFQLPELEPGKYTISVKAWDIANNSGESMTEFNVIDHNGDNLNHVLNYPNPFTTSTNFWFEHDLAGNDLDVLVYIYTVTGKVVKTINVNIPQAPSRISDLQWDGKDDFGNKLGKGVYLYKVKAVARQLNQSRESNFEKIMLL